MQIDAASYGIMPGQDVSEGFIRLFQALREQPGEKIVTLAPGRYHISREKVQRVQYFVTNTVAQSVYTPENDHMLHIALHLDGLSDLVLDGQGAEFILDGQMTNLVLNCCRNVTLRNLTLCSISPDLHRFTVEQVRGGHIVFRLDGASRYEKRGRQYVFTGNGYTTPFFHKRNTAFWNGRIAPDNPLRITRGAHPLRGCIALQETGDHLFTAYYLKKPAFPVGMRFYVYDVERTQTGIFVNQSENITLEGVWQQYNHGLAFVGQDSRNLTVRSCRFAPDSQANPEDSSRMEVASHADFMQICMCAGDINVTDSFFDGAGDDTINVHGVHFTIAEVKGRQMQVQFRHEQCYGFNPLHAGDRVAFIAQRSLLEQGQAVIVSSELQDRQTILLTLDRDGLERFQGMALEDIDRCPNLYFARNSMQRIITRGILVTTRGKVLIEDNEFIDTAMGAIVISDDAKNWYESGMVKDVTIRNNRFLHCGDPYITILPENSAHEGAVHENITITGNRFAAVPQKAILLAKSAQNIRFAGNALPTGMPQEKIARLKDVTGFEDVITSARNSN